MSHTTEFTGPPPLLPLYPSPLLCLPPVTVFPPIFRKPLFPSPSPYSIDSASRSLARIILVHVTLPETACNRARSCIARNSPRQEFINIHAVYARFSVSAIRPAFSPDFVGRRSRRTFWDDANGTVVDERRPLHYLRRGQPLPLCKRHYGRCPLQQREHSPAVFTSLYSITMPEVISSGGRVMVIDTDSINYVRVGETFVFPAANVSKRRLPRGTLHRNVAAVNSARVL